MFRSGEKFSVKFFVRTNVETQELFASPGNDHLKLSPIRLLPEHLLVHAPVLSYIVSVYIRLCIRRYFLWEFLSRISSEMKECKIASLRVL